MDLPLYEQVLRLLLALVLGSIIGFERERTAHSAGLRTHALVCVGSALIILVSTYGFPEATGANGVVLDPSRVAAQVVSGIGFVGAGTIIVQRSNIRGLTTAAGLWMVAGIGLAAGAGMYAAATAGALIALVILVPLKVVEQNFVQHVGLSPDSDSDRLPPTNALTGRPQRQYRRRRAFRRAEGAKTGHHTSPA